MMLLPQPLCRRAWLVSLCLLTQCHLPMAAPLSQGLEGQLSKVQDGLHSQPEAGAQKGSGEEIFQDVDPKALAAILLQALETSPQKPNELLPLSPKAGASEERVQSGSTSVHMQQAWKSRQEREKSLEEEWKEVQEGPFGQKETESLKATLKQLQQASPAIKREEPPQGHPEAAPKPPQGSQSGDLLRDLEEYQPFTVHAKRKAPPSEPWAGARKLRQQQHLEHQLLQRRYEELAESRRQAEEARRAAAEEERLADMASDLLLQYLLKDGEEEEEEQKMSDEEGSKGPPLLFEDEEDNVAEDKRSNETPEAEEEEEEEEGIDPNTIDRLIELSSKLHLPADDVIDIINDVEKKKKEEGPEPKSRLLLAPPPSKPKKTPSYPATLQEVHPIPKAFYPAAFQTPHRLPKEEEAAWNEVLRGHKFPAPKRFQEKAGSTKISNHISPWTFQPSVYHRYPQRPGPMGPREGYYDSQARGEDLDSYLDRLLLKPPKAF